MPYHYFPWLHQERGYDIMVRPKKTALTSGKLKQILC